MTSIEDRRAHWQAQVAAQRASGLTIAAWCAEHNVSSHTLSYWRGKFNESPSRASDWVLVAPEPTVANNPLQVRVGAATVEVSSGFDANLLRDVVSALAQC
jgi:transposase-like protein